MLECLFLFFSMALGYTNYRIAKKDFLNPSVVFCIMNFLSAIVCLAVKNIFRVEIHTVTLVVLISGMLIFTITNAYCKIKRWKIGIIPIKTGYYNHQTSDWNGMKKLKINSIWIYIFIAFEILVSYYMLKFAVDVSKSFFGTNEGGILTHLGNYNNIRKNFTEDLQELRVHYSSIQKYGWPLCISLGIICFGVFSNNYCITKKIDVKLLAVSGLPVVMGFFLGSRSMSFRFATAYIIEYIFIKRYQVKSYKKGNRKLFRVLFFLGIALAFFFYFIINVIGRSTSIIWYEYVSAYIGSPIFNLDHFLCSDYVISDFFGKQTFFSAYSFLGRLLNKKEWIYELNIPYIWTNGVYFGNVYTMYYMFIQDFGIVGIFPLSYIISRYYNNTYYILKREMRTESVLCIRLFVFSYLFNDIIMLTFSNRFFETVFSSTSIYALLWLFILWLLMKYGFFSKNFLRTEIWGTRKKDGEILYEIQQGDEKLSV